MLKTLKKRLNNQRGLTLVELLAVIVILGIISAIAVPSIGNIIEKSKDNAAVSDALQIINAAKLAHAADHDGSSWNQTALDDYLSNVSDDAFTVTFDTATNTYSISGHEAALAVFNKGKTTDLKTSLTEKELTAKTNE